MKKIAVFVTARPSYARIRSALVAMRSDPDVELVVVAAASALLERYGRVVDTIEADGFTVAARLHSVVEGNDPAQSVQTVGLGLISASQALAKLRPDAVVTIADRYETIATAIAASYMNIPLIHIQGGEFTGNIDNKVRHAITKLSDLHLVASRGAWKRVVGMGEDPARTVITGCPSVDIADQVKRSFAGPKTVQPILDRAMGVGHPVRADAPFIVVMQHPVTSQYEDAQRQAEMTLEATYKTGLPVVWFWPNVDAGSDGTSKALRRFREQHPDAPYRFFKNLPPQDFLALLLGAGCLIGNSSVGIRECAFLGVPVVNIGNRQTGRERGPNVIDTSHDVEDIVQAITAQVAHGSYEASHIYGDGTAGPQIAAQISAQLARMALDIEKRDFFNGMAMTGQADWDGVLNTP